MPAATTARWRHPERWLAAAAGVALIVLVSGPLVALVLTAFRATADALPFEPQASWTLENVRRLLTDASLFASVVPTTVVYTVAVVALAMALGTFFAWLIERTDIGGRSALFVALVSPLVIPTVVKAIAWVMLAGPAAGYVNVALRRLFAFGAPGPLNIFTLPGLILGQTLELVPLGVIFMTAAFRGLDPSFEDASALSGAGPWTTLRRVTIPVLLPATLALAVVLTTLTLEMVELPLAIGTPGGVRVFSTWMFLAMNQAGLLPDYGFVAAATAPVFGLGLAALWLYNRATRTAERYVTLSGKGFRPRRVSLGIWRPLAWLVTATYVMVALAVPAGIMLVTSIFPGAARSARALLQPPSLEAYRAVLGDPTTALAFRNTVVAGGTGATAAVALSVVVAWLVVRTTVPGRRWLDFMTFAPLTIPAVIMGFAVALLYLVVPIGIYGTVWILAVAYATRLAVASRILRASLLQVHRDLEDASAVSGATMIQTLCRVVVPLLSPAIGVAWLLLFVVSFREFTIGMILYRPGNVVVGVHLWRLYERGELAQASALGFSMIAIVAVLGIVVRRALMPDWERA
ncbi:MAG: iron ABC transporter permease [Vicinamibacterales bacterium]